MTKIQAQTQQIDNLFPTPIGMYMYNSDIKKSELNFINKLEKTKNVNNYISVDKNILDNPKLKNIRSFIEEQLEQYFFTVYKPIYEISPYITQSWSNYTDFEQSHHSHNHSNSFISGVFYFSCEETDGITFQKQQSNGIDIPCTDWNIWNSPSWTYPVTKGMLILFPSNLFHCVTTKVGESQRISLAFNTFLKGQLGEKKLSNLLII